VVILLFVAAILMLRSGSDSQAPTTEGAGISNGRFSNDSLGVILVQVPPQRGWRLARSAPMMGAPVVTAESSAGEATWELYVTPGERVNGLEDVLRRRRDQLASRFGINDLDQVVGKVLSEDVKDRDGYPAVQWQAISRPVDVAGDEPIHVMFMWVATLRERFAYEGVGLLRIPVDRTQASAASTDSLMQDLAFILETMQFD
jgi:hypothetical protein